MIYSDPNRWDRLDFRVPLRFLGRLMILIGVMGITCGLPLAYFYPQAEWVLITCIFSYIIVFTGACINDANRREN